MIIHLNIRNRLFIYDNQFVTRILQKIEFYSTISNIDIK